MYMDNEGEMCMDTEVGNQKINGCKINLKDIRNIADRLDELILSLEKTERCEYAYKKLDNYYEILRQYLPDELKVKLVNDMDDAITELFILYADHFYKHGHNDGIECISILLSGLKSKHGDL